MAHFAKKKILMRYIHTLNKIEYSLKNFVVYIGLLISVKTVEVVFWKLILLRFCMQL